MRIFRVATVFLIFAATAWAQTVFQNPDYKYIVDVPVGWELLDAERTDFVSFTDPDHVGVFQVLSFPGSQFATVEEIDRYISRSFNTSGDAAPFLWSDNHAMFADYSFDAGGIPVRGYMVFVNRSDYDFAVMTYVVTDYYDQLHDAILSTIDGFSFDAASRNAPGPVSQFYHPMVSAEDRQPASTGQSAPVLEPSVVQEDQTESPASGASNGEPGGAGFPALGPEAVPSSPDQVAPEPGRLPLPSGAVFDLPDSLTNESTLEAAQVLIEREARILSTYAPGPQDPTRIGEGTAPAWAQAWRRYYRMIYRDNFDRLQPVAEELYMDLARSGVARERMPAEILRWLQRFEYERTGSLSDLMSPANCLVNFAGDCDSLGLTYAILLHHLGFDAVLMVSLEYSHAMTGVDVAGEGARFPFEGTQWLVAELTDDVQIGLIDQRMADPGGWVGIKLDPTM